MKLIDLLSKIANGEELPPKIQFHNLIWVLKSDLDYCEDYYSKDLETYLFYNKWALTNNLNDEVEILEEEKKITPTDFENLGYALGSIQKYINKGYDKAIEEKKIPEKLIPTSLKGIDNLDEKIEIAHIDTISVIETLNKVLDYLKSKGE